MDFTEEPQRIISLCSGIRGIERGLERVLPNVRTVCHVEVEAVIIENLVAEMETGMVAAAPVWTDLKTFTPYGLREKIHGVVGGYPCQPFSVAGRKKGVEDPRHLWPYVYRVVAIVRPDWCVFENVRNHLNLGYEQVREDLQGLGYTVEEGIFSAEETGAVHKRERLFILAVRSVPQFRELLAHTYDNGFTRHNRGASPGEDDKGGWKKCPSPLGTRRASAQARGLSEDQTTAEELVHSDRERFGEERICKNGLDISSVVDHTEHLFGSEGSWLQEEHRGGFADATPSPSTLRELANAAHERVEGERSEGNGLSQIDAGQTLSLCGGGRTVARPGEQQHNWEEPRTIVKEIEPSLGLSAHGYLFREDFLRAIGNAVYSPSAELAFRTLSEKFKEGMLQAA